MPLSEKSSCVGMIGAAPVRRRDVLLAGGLALAGASLPLVGKAQTPPTLGEGKPLGALRIVGGPEPFPGVWYEGASAGDGLEFRVEPGTLANSHWLTADFLLDGIHTVAWRMIFHEAGSQRAFRYAFGGLNQCSFRMRMPLEALANNRWRYEREGAWLKPLCGGDRVDPARVDRITLSIDVKAEEPARWRMSPIAIRTSEPARLDKPHLPKGALVDELGQSRLHSWPGKTKDAEACTARLRSQLAAAPKQTWPSGFTRWGGGKERRLAEGSRFFGKHHDGKRWWLTDPDGYAFWSTGLDCVRVDATAAVDGLETALTWTPPRDGMFADAWEERRSGLNYLAANCIRAFGPKTWRDDWATIALSELKRLRFNTVANWSEWEFAARAGFPYVRPMSFNPKRIASVYRDFPDVFDKRFADDAADYASELGSTRDDPAFLGYFLMNEPTWGFSSELPAVGMLYATPSCETRKELARRMGASYGDSKSLAAAWKMPVTLEQIAAGAWRERFTPEALTDLEAFSSVMVEHYFRELSAACKRVDSNHMNLGMRWAGVPPKWAVAGMKYFDVYSINCYQEKVPASFPEEIQRLLQMPTMIGEWHFGALDVGLPASGLGRVATQEDRGRAYRIYAEDSMANPNCVGVHWFTLYDQSALGRFDGENYNIGFLDICNRPYPEIGAAAIASHEAMYALATGTRAPFRDAPTYLRRVSV